MEKRRKERKKKRYRWKEQTKKTQDIGKKGDKEKLKKKNDKGE